jgi:hypothetical protein
VGCVVAGGGDRERPSSAGGREGGPRGSGGGVKKRIMGVAAGERLHQWGQLMKQVKDKRREEVGKDKTRQDKTPKQNKRGRKKGRQKERKKERTKGLHNI